MSGRVRTVELSAAAGMLSSAPGSRHNENHAEARHVQRPRLTAAAMSADALRLAARVILLDPGDRVLLMRYDSPDGSHWSTPGGGLDEGGDYRAAALRELAGEQGGAISPCSARFTGAR